MVEFTQEKIIVQDLVQGMFVARLDRPWVGTPFPIQGFHIRNLDEIRQLASLCSYVYVDVVKSRVSLDRARRSRSLPGHDQPLRLTRLKSGEVSHPRTRTLSQEVSTAGSLHDDVARAIDQVMAQVTADRPVNLPATRKVAGRMVDSIIRNPDAAMWIARIRKWDAHTYSHCVRSSIWAIAFGRHLELHRDRLQNLALGIMLSEVGFTRMPVELRDKSRSLNPADVDHIKQHVALGIEILKEIPGIHEEALSVVQHHHERFDGSGYPKGLRGSRIPLFGQIAGIVDVYDMLTAPRSDSEGLSPTAAMARLHDMIDREFQRELIEEFIRAIGIYPTGTLIELTSGEVGVITEQNAERRLRPKILLLLDKDKNPLKTPREIDLMSVTTDRQGNAIDIARSLPHGTHGIDLSQHHKSALARMLGIGNHLLRN